MVLSIKTRLKWKLIRLTCIQTDNQTPPTHKTDPTGANIELRVHRSDLVLTADLKVYLRIRGVVEDVSDVVSAGGDTASACKRKSLAA
jgi:hypothetical protein